MILSRIRRTADAHVVLTQVLASYVSFLGAARMVDRSLLEESWGILRLTGPVLAVLAGLLMADAYADPRRPSPFGVIRAPLVGVGLALWSQVLLWAGSTAFAVPHWAMAYGCAINLLLSTGVRILFPPAVNPLKGVHAPAAWLKQEDAPLSAGFLRVARETAPILAVLVVALIAYQVWKRAVP